MNNQKIQLKQSISNSGLKLTLRGENNVLFDSFHKMKNQKIQLKHLFFNSGLELTLRGENNVFIVSMFDSFHNKHLNIRKFSNYDEALNNYNIRKIGL